VTPFAELALVLAMFVLTPLTMLRVVGATPTVRSARLMLAAYPISALSALGALALDQGPLSGAIACGWLAFTIIAFGHGLARALPRSTMRLEESCVDAGLAYLAVGGLWFAIWRSGAAFASIDAHTALLTAIHFHYAGFVSLVLCGFAARELRARDERAWRWLRLTAVAVIAGPAAVAVGIASSRVLESVAAIVLACSISVFAVVAITRVAGSRRSQLPRALLGISAIAAILAMVLGVLYAVGGLFGVPTVSVADMERTHGVLNAIGYALCGVVAWLIEPPREAILGRGPPFSSLASGLRVGADFFERRALISTNTRVRGLVDDLGEFDSREFEAARVAPSIRAFYEDTATFDLRLFPRWHGAARRFARGYASLSARLEQVHYEPAGADGAGIESRIVALDPAVDGRSGVRGWVRWYRDTGRAIYVAAYATHRDAQRVYMNIAFPLPAGNLASILRAENQGADGLVLTSHPHPARPGHEGVYFAMPMLPVRLPINETIWVWSVEDRTAPHDLVGRREPTTVAVARHQVWLFRSHVLTLDYAIDEASALRSVTKDL
jgi:hypothetical protein